jgi:hypothetical protein
MTIDFTKTPLTEIYGCNCFNDAVMRERLPKSIYKEVKLVQEGTRDLDADVAEVVAYAMKDWAIEKGATHFTHWFTPPDGTDRGEARCFHLSHRRRPGHPGILRERTDQGGTRCFLFSQRRTAGHL